jgi:hypothetical protein
VNEVGIEVSLWTALLLLAPGLLRLWALGARLARGSVRGRGGERLTPARPGLDR